MIAVVLCAGYATRLYPLTENKSKALLPIEGKPLLDYTIEKVGQIVDVDMIYVVTNDKFYKDFLNWKKINSFGEKIRVLNDKTTCNAERLGGIGDLHFVIKKENINDDILVVLGDTIFNFDLRLMVDSFKKTNCTTLGVYRLQDFKQSQILGLVLVKDGKVLSIKDGLVTKESNIIFTGIHIFIKSDIKRIEKYMKTDKPKEGPGYLIMEWLSSKEVRAHVFEGRWFDIGTKETYDEVNHLFSER
ncbi:MAG: sugar phosphate nucleotidyltransferase [archaeon]